MKLLWIAAALLTTACAPPRTILVPEEPWLAQAVEGAARFWAEEPRLVDFQLVGQAGEADLTVVVSDDMYEDAVGSYNLGQIRVRPDVQNWSTIDSICVIAHELGHSLGMDHVEGEPSLMNASVPLFDRECSWSDLDWVEFCQTNDC